MNRFLRLSTVLLLAACSTPATPEAVDAQAARPANAESKRAAELAVKVANGKASPDERAELEAFVKGKK